MDVIKTTPKAIIRKRYILAIVMFMLAISLYFWGNDTSVNKNNILITSVTTGDLPIVVEGYGKLVSEKMTLITATTSATVKEILLKPGALVTKNSIIAILENPALAMQRENEQQELGQRQANLRQLKVNLQRETLTEQALLTEIQSAHQSAKLKREAEQQLVQSGIISQITFKQSQLNERQLETRVKILTERLQKLGLVHKEALLIEQQRVKQQLSKLENIQQLLNKLTVKANFDGVIQRMNIKLGQSLNAGQEIALIGSTQALIAEIVIPQNQMARVRLHQKVTLDTRQTTIAGEVMRIDPIVAQNMVKIDVNITDKIPNNTRPEQNVDAKIFIKELTNIAFIERPANIEPHSQQMLYRLNKTGNVATRVSIRFGEISGRYVQVLSVVEQGDRFIISDLTNYSAESLVLN